MNAAIYARVSTADQDLQRQLDDAREHLHSQYEDLESIEQFADVVSGADEAGGDEYHRLWDEIESGDLDVVIVCEISRLSRLGPTEIHEFIQHCLENGVGVESLEIGLSIRVEDPALQQTVYTMVANIMGDLAKIEHEQKLERIQSGIRAAQNAGKWTSKPPVGFKVVDSRLRVDVDEFLAFRDALLQVEAGASVRSVAQETGFPRTTLSDVVNDDRRRRRYLGAEAEDERVDAALKGIRPLPDADVDAEEDELEQRVEELVEEKMQALAEDD